MEHMMSEQEMKPMMEESKMPVPEMESMEACMRFMRKDKPDMPMEQKQAICLDMMRKKGKKVAPKKE